MKQELKTKNEVTEMILANKKLILAGDESVLADLPKGHWIGGTIPYFMTAEGGVISKDMVYVTEMPSMIKSMTLRTYSLDSIEKVYDNSPENGFTFLIVTGGGLTLETFGLSAPSYSNFGVSPVVGWIAGTHVSEIGQKNPKVYLGETGKVREDGAVAIHANLPAGKYADLSILNIFKQGTGDVITFDSDGFVFKDVNINGEKKNLAEYIAENEIDIRLPLVADYFGASINVSFQSVDQESKTVHFYAPLVKGVEYRQAAVLPNDYAEEFKSNIPTESKDAFFTCNCILNFLYGELEGKPTGVTGPITFGEIGYQLLNQTMVFLSLNDL